MNSQYSQNKDPNKVKKCNCEDKYGPKPFMNTNTNSKNSINKSK